jgi:hypothetical protein
MPILHCYEREVYGHPCEALRVATSECIRLSAAEIDAICKALEFEGYGTARSDLIALLRERQSAVDVT